MERRGRAAVATLYAPELSALGEIALDANAAHHAVVRRLAKGDAIQLTNGEGILGSATISELRKSGMVADVLSVEEVSRLPRLEVLAPVADRERMLWLAEKCAELAISVWQPVLFARSKSVSPRGEGEAFAAKVRARMIAALEQSGGAWLPEVRRELALGDAVARVESRMRFVLDPDGPPLSAHASDHGIAVTFGPEGGIDAGERSLLVEAGWRPAALGPTTLRFETAGIAAVAILRAASTAAHTNDQDA